MTDIRYYLFYGYPMFFGFTLFSHIAFCSQLTERLFAWLDKTPIFIATAAGLLPKQRDPDDSKSEGKLSPPGSGGG